MRPSEPRRGLGTAGPAATVLLAVLLIAPAPDAATPDAAAPGAAEAAEREALATARLSPETRALMIEEMQAIDAAMDRVHTALVTGDHAAVADEAQAIHDSFVLEQALSDTQRAEIRSLPRSFVARDREFHHLASRLLQAAEARDVHLERVWYEEMTRACLGCHREFASARFPGLAPAPTDTGRSDD